MVTEQQLAHALEAWEVARDKAALLQGGLALVTNSHKALIASLRSHGYTWAQANAEFERLSRGHVEDVVAAYKDMDRLCGDYQDLARRYEEQKG